VVWLSVKPQRDWEIRSEVSVCVKCFRFTFIMIQTIDRQAVG